MSKKHFFSVLSLLLILLTTSDMPAQNPNRPGGSRRKTRINGRSINVKPRSVLDTTACISLTVRTIDGTCNNTSLGSRMEYGATDIELIRLLPAEYSTSDPFEGLGGENRRS
ncbi:MAG: hypothetical protein AAFN10_28085, partial [Bacteroidota bacterium]